MPGMGPHHVIMWCRFIWNSHKSQQIHHEVHEWGWQSAVCFATLAPDVHLWEQRDTCSMENETAEIHLSIHIFHHLCLPLFILCLFWKCTLKCLQWHAEQEQRGWDAWIIQGKHVTEKRNINDHGMRFFQTIFCEDLLPVSSSSRLMKMCPHWTDVHPGTRDIQSNDAKSHKSADSWMQQHVNKPSQNYKAGTTG
jgi:hypothetical protein